MERLTWQKHKLVFVTALLMLALLTISSLLLRNDAGAAAARQEALVDPASPGMHVASFHSGGAAANSVGRDTAASLRWDVSAIPAGSTVTAASLTLVSDRAFKEPLLLHAAVVGAGKPGGIVLGSIQSGEPGRIAINLNPHGLSVVQKWIERPLENHGFALVGGEAEGDTGGLRLSDARLTVVYQ